MRIYTSNIEIRRREEEGWKDEEEKNMEIGKRVSMMDTIEAR